MRELNWMGALAVACLPLLFGCGNGGSSQPTVKIKPSRSDDGAGNRKAVGAGTSGGATVASGTGTLKGRVVFQGDSPSLAPLVKQGAATKDAKICAAHAVPNERLVVGAGGGVKNVFIYLPKPPEGADVPPPPKKPATFDQKGCRFIPHAMLVRTDRTIRVKSDDPIAHNTHTFPKRNNRFNQVIKAGDRVGADLVYTKPEAQPIEVKCDFHSWMLAYHLPLDHPYAALSNENGEFEIKDLPAGVHSFRVWHEGVGGGYLNRRLTVTIEANQVTTIVIPYPAANFSVASGPATKSVKLSSLLK